MTNLEILTNKLKRRIKVQEDTKEFNEIFDDDMQWEYEEYGMSEEQFFIKQGIESRATLTEEERIQLFWEEVEDWGLDSALRNIEADGYKINIEINKNNT